MVMFEQLHALESCDVYFLWFFLFVFLANANYVSISRYLLFPFAMASRPLFQMAISADMGIAIN
jgi:hypothetical protein